MAEVRSRIVSGELAYDAQLPTEADMAARFGVSRSLLREALSELRAEGLVVTIAGKGSFVARRSEERLAEGFTRLLGVQSASWPPMGPTDLYEARTALEVLAAELAATRAGVDQLDELETLVQKMRDSADDPASYTAADVGFHIAVARASGNAILPSMLAPLVAAIVRANLESCRRPGAT